MRMQIAFRLRPFVLRPGVPVLVPGTRIVATPYPTKIELSDVSGKQLGEIDPGVRGPVEGFTVHQDLERCCVSAWGQSAEGFFRWHLFPHANRDRVLFQKDKVWGAREAIFRPLMTERLSLGSHKVLDWDLVLKRRELSEFLPVLCRLGQLSPVTSSVLSGASLLTNLQEAISEGRRDRVESDLLALFRAGFHGLMVPSALDRLSQGFACTPLPPLTDPLALLTLGAACIRELFLRDTSHGGVEVLPLVPSRLVCGRLVQAQCQYGQLNVEWTKQSLRRMSLRSTVNAEAKITFPKSVASLRLRRSRSDRGIQLDARESFSVCEGEIIWFDRFQS